jgi:hypothetical protein
VAMSEMESRKLAPRTPNRLSLFPKEKYMSTVLNLQNFPVARKPYSGASISLSSCESGSCN